MAKRPKPKACERGYNLPEFKNRTRLLFRQRYRAWKISALRNHDLQELKLAVLYRARALAEHREFTPACTFSNLTGEAIRHSLPEIMRTLRGVRFSRSIFQTVQRWVWDVAKTSDVKADLTPRLDAANAAIVESAGLDAQRDTLMYGVDQSEPPDPADWWKPGFQE